MKLVYKSSQKQVQIGDVVHVGGKPWVVTTYFKPHPPATWSGRVGCTSMCGRKYYSEWKPTVIGAGWIEMETP